MKEKLAKLIDVKSIMTLILTVVFCVLALTGVISGQEFLTIFTVIVGFYFGTQVQKKVATPTYNVPSEGAGATDNEAAEETSAVQPEAIQGELQPPDMKNA